MVHTKIQSDVKKERVGMLSYQVTGFFRIVYRTDHGGYFVQHISSPHSFEMKCIEL